MSELFEFGEAAPPGRNGILVNEAIGMLTRGVVLFYIADRSERCPEHFNLRERTANLHPEEQRPTNGTIG